MTFAQIIEVFHRSRYVHVSEEHGVFFVWHGGLTVNIYGMAGEALDCFTMGGTTVTVAELIQECKTHFDA